MKQKLAPPTPLAPAEPIPGYCPYYRRLSEAGSLHCEAGRLRFPDAPGRRAIVYRFCAHPEGYKACMLKVMLDEYYERKYAHENQKA